MPIYSRGKIEIKKLTRCTIPEHVCGLVSNGTFEIETREIGYSQLRERE